MVLFWFLLCSAWFLVGVLVGFGWLGLVSVGGWLAVGWCGGWFAVGGGWLGDVCLAASWRLDGGWLAVGWSFVGGCLSVG